MNQPNIPTIKDISYADIKVDFDPRKVWRMDSYSMSEGISFNKAWTEQEVFKLRREHLRKGIFEPINDSLDNSHSEEQVGTNLDPVFERMSKGFLMSDHINPDLLLAKANKNTINKKLQPWCDQANKNAEVVRANPGVKIFKDFLKDVPCIIVTAGPSLKNALEHLKSVRGKALVICVGTSLRTCLKRDIHVDFVNSHDANGPMLENNWGGGPKFFKNLDAKNTIGLFVNYIHPLTIEAYSGPKCFYYVEDDGLPVYKTMALAHDSPDRKDGSFLPSCVIGGSSVAHTAMYLAIQFGCNPITFVGLDLSYPSMERSHFESDNMKDMNRKQLMDVKSVNGKTVKTELSFYSYKTVFDRMAPVMSVINKRELFNSSQNDDGSPAGIVHAGLEPMPLKEWIDKYANTNREELGNILKEWNKYGNKLQK